MNDYENGIITGSIGLGVDYYKGEKGDKPVKGVDYFTKEDIDEIAAQIEGDGIDLSDYAKKEDVEAAIAGITFPTETDPVFTASAAASITPTDISSWNSKSDFSGDYEDLTNKPTIPTKTSDLTNDSDFVAQSELSDYATKSYVDDAVANVPTGGEYTAGSGIEIDENNVISNLNYPDFMWLILKENFANDIDVIKKCFTKQQVIDGLNGGRIVYLPNAIAEGLNIGSDNTELNNSYLGYVNLINYGTSELSGYTSASQLPLEQDTYLYAKKKVIFKWKKGNITPHIQYNNKGTPTTLGNMFESINTSLANKQDAIIPAVPTTDGSYKLTTSISSGTATTEWTEDSGSGSSYTFTNGLTESDGTVSWNLYDRIRKGQGERSILEGTATNAGVDAHAEGEYTKANGAASHAEGESTTASGYASHAEGNNTVASGARSHAEGVGTHAIGAGSHAEGIGTYTFGEYSHAEGNYTEATGNNSHAEGQYNVADSNSIFQNIAGNGTPSAHSNSFARDWNGNEYLAGDLFVNCSDYTTDANGLTTENAGGSKVATESYVDQAIADIPTGGEYTADVDDLFIASIYSQLGLSDSTIASSIAPLPIAATADEFIELSKKGVWFDNIYSNGFVSSDFSKLKSELGITNIRQININSSGVALSANNFQYNYNTNSLTYRFYKVGNAGIYVMITNIQDIKKLGEFIKNAIPAVPTTDGSYKLTTSISSGTATTEWTEDSGSGGSSYTAGDGISIDSNNVISNTIPVYDTVFRGRRHTKEEQIQALLKGYILYDPTDNMKITKEDLGLSQCLQEELVNEKTINRTNQASYTCHEYTMLKLIKKADNAGVLEWFYGGNSRKFKFFQVRNDTGYTGNHTTIVGDIVNLNTRIPTAPTADGSYKLTSTTTSGSSTYSWVADSGSTSYTAGNGISIDSNGVISLDLSSAEGVGF